MKQNLIFNDAWSYGSSRVRLDARWKILATVVGFALLFGFGIKVSLLVLAGALIGVALNGYPWRFFMTRISFPIIIALFYFFTKALWSGGEVLFSWQVGQWQFMVYQQGVYQGAAAALRIISGVSMVIWLSLTTSVAEFIAAARWYRVPVVILELLVFIYHYIFILWQEAARVFQAQQLRLGHEKWRHSFMNMIKLAALVFVRAIDRAEVAAQAMQLRGYEENLPLEIFERRNP